MDGSDWVAAIAAFLGGLIGAGLSTWVALRGQRQTEREEWYRRFLAAVDHLTAPSKDRHEIGEDMLAELVESDLGTPQERALARQVLRGQLETEVLRVEGPLRLTSPWCLMSSCPRKFFRASWKECPRNRVWWSGGFDSHAFAYVG